MLDSAAVTDHDDDDNLLVIAGEDDDDRRLSLTVLQDCMISCWDTYQQTLGMALRRRRLSCDLAGKGNAQPI
jgi:hypothetical protein